MGYAGFDLPIAPTPDPAADLEHYVAFRQALDEAGLPPFGVTTNVAVTAAFDPTSPDPVVCEAALAYLESRVDITAALGGKVMAGPGDLSLRRLPTDGCGTKHLERRVAGLGTGRLQAGTAGAGGAGRACRAQERARRNRAGRPLGDGGAEPRLRRACCPRRGGEPEHRRLHRQRACGARQRRAGRLCRAGGKGGPRRAPARRASLSPRSWRVRRQLDRLAAFPDADPRALRGDRCSSRSSTRSRPSSTGSD